MAAVSPTILVVDDSEDDVMFLLRAFCQTDVNNQVHICGSGQHALDYLASSSLALPGLIFLDLKMPGMNGFEVLTAIKSHPEWRQVRTVILTTSSLPIDSERAQKLGADDFLAKPMTGGEMRSMVRAFPKEWLNPL